MHPVSTVTVSVPATTANLGPGFDCIGAALTLYNQFKFTRLEADAVTRLSITVEGTEAARVNTGADNLVYQSFVKLYEHIGKTPPPVQIEIELGVPLARGLGSSATAIVGGLVGANCLAGAPLDENEVGRIAIALEGHPDNVVPALLGGCRLAATGLSDEPHRHGESKEEWAICEIPWHSEIVPVVAIPDFELSTEEARRVLPTQYSRADAIFNTAHLGLLLRGLETGRGDWLRVAMQDRIHQPYRTALIRGYDAVRSAAMASGAFGMVISGAGPTLLALAEAALAPTVVEAMAAAWKDEGIMAQVRSLSIDTHGAKTSNIS
ncbi:homoserine kinase [Coleofasciculus sp. FACHB-64]|uniref:homoserine kinase n=1 Tax=Cyanophyceae TaxID=3028117 RepID=UPI001681E519|nr:MULTISPECIES: homoserine kinase [unclassified Coleofasciculus]MBD1894832.1 homoserine kinase [Coleofasciculus sp. FACHB-129]MBD2044662.1 homoserine kinase [Coleofasciculus sp. FACHB-64]